LTFDLSSFDVAAILAKALTYASTLAAAGTAFFFGYGEARLHARERVHLRRLVYWLAAIGMVSTALRISLLSGSMSDAVSGMFDRSFAAMILAAGEGRASCARIAGLVLLVVALAVRKRGGFLALGGAALAASSFAWVGHAQALHRTWPAALLVLHLFCAAFWLGALYPLLHIARRGEPAQLAALAERFGRIAMFLVSLLVLAGVALLIALLPSFDALWQSDYGRLVVTKLSLVAALLAAAGFNRLKLTPRLARGEADAVAMLRHSIRLEMVLAVCILLVTALFTSASGPDG
jgi:putative copper export protein